MEGKGGESHAKAVIVAGSGGTKGIMSQDLGHFGRKIIQITDAINYDYLCQPSSPQKTIKGQSL